MALYKYVVSFVGTEIALFKYVVVNTGGYKYEYGKKIVKIN